MAATLRALPLKSFSSLVIDTIDKRENRTVFHMPVAALGYLLAHSSRFILFCYLKSIFLTAIRLLLTPVQ